MLACNGSYQVCIFIHVVMRWFGPNHHIATRRYGSGALSLVDAGLGPMFMISSGALVATCFWR